MRASALRLYASVPRALPNPRLFALVDDPQPLVRAEALSLLAQLPPSERWRRAGQRLQDSDCLVRLEAAELLADLPPEFTGDEGARQLSQAVAALARSLEEQADFAANATQLAQLQLRRAIRPRARRWLAHALARDPQFAGAYLVSSEIERVAGDKPASARVLEQGLARLPQAANLHYALGLALVRSSKSRRRCSTSRAPSRSRRTTARFAYTYAVALHNKGEPARAIQVLEQTLRGQPETDNCWSRSCASAPRAASRSCWSATCRPSSRCSRTTLCCQPLRAALGRAMRAPSDGAP